MSQTTPKWSHIAAALIEDHKVVASKEEWDGRKRELSM